jgi:hypothetical protein
LKTKKELTKKEDKARESYNKERKIHLEKMSKNYDFLKKKKE